MSNLATAAIDRPKEVYAIFERATSRFSVFSPFFGEMFCTFLGEGYPTPVEPLIRGYTGKPNCQLYEAELEDSLLLIRLPKLEVSIKFPSLEIYKEVFVTGRPVLLGTKNCLHFGGKSQSWKFLLSSISAYAEEQYPVPYELKKLLLKYANPEKVEKNQLYRWFFNNKPADQSTLQVQVDFVDFCIHRFPALFPTLLKWKGILMSKQSHVLDFGLESIQQSYAMSYPKHKIEGKTFAQSTSAIARAKPQAFLRHRQLSRMTATYGLTKLPSSWGEFAKAAMSRKIHPGLARRDWMEYLETTRPKYAETIQKWRARERKIYAQTFGRRS